MTYAHRDSNCCFPVPDDNAFNALRFGFCLVVIIMHCLARSQTLAPYARFFDGHLAVCAFFILSGFWVTKSYRADERPLAFYRKRAQRLLPLYYMTVVGCAVLLACVSTLPARAYFSDRRFFAYLFWNGIFLNFMQPSLPGVFDGGAVNGSLWTIKVEIGFYLILPLLVALLRRLARVASRICFWRRCTCFRSHGTCCLHATPRRYMCRNSFHINCRVFCHVLFRVWHIPSTGKNFVGWNDGL